MCYGDVVEVIKTKDDLEFTLKDGSHYKALSASYNARGYKWEYAYIDVDIDYDLVYQIILPSFYPKFENGMRDHNAKIDRRIIWY